jgi:hypothetical protein
VTQGVAQYALIGTAILAALVIAVAFVWALVETLRKDVVPALRELGRWLARTWAEAKAWRAKRAARQAPALRHRRERR